MDFGESDDEELPTHVDSTTDSIEVDATTASTFQSPTSTDRSLPLQEPLSPTTARKRANEEIYERPDRPLPSTTPLKTPPKVSFEDRISSGRNQRSSFKVSFKDVHSPESATPSASMAATTSDIREPEKQIPTSPNPFVQSIAAYQKQLEEEFREYEKGLESRDRAQELRTLDWKGLEDRYQEETSLKIADENQIMQDFEARFAQFLLWMRVSGNRESERAVKRLRTRVAFVQNSEHQLNERQDHYEKVLIAFQNAMALLGNA